MFSTKSNISITEFLKFHGHNYQQQADKMTSIFLITKVIGVIDGSPTAQTASASVEPPMPTGTTTTANWTAYGAKINAYATQQAKWWYKKNKFKDDN